MKQIINLDARAEDRRKVLVHGETVALYDRDELAPVDTARVVRLARRMDALKAKDPLTPEEEQELANGPAAICALVVADGSEAVAKISDRERWAICLAFAASDPAPAAVSAEASA